MAHTRSASVMALAMVLSPNLATMTYAAPHLIHQSAISYVMGAASLNVAPPAALSPHARRPGPAYMVAQDPPPQPRRTAREIKMQQTAEKLQADAVETETANADGVLVHRDNTWRVIAQGVTSDLVDGEISDARL